MEGNRWKRFALAERGGERETGGEERRKDYRCWRGARVRRVKPGCWSVVGDSKQFQECVACVSSALI